MDNIFYHSFWRDCTKMGLKQQSDAEQQQSDAEQIGDIQEMWTRIKVARKQTKAADNDCNRIVTSDTIT